MGYEESRAAPWGWVASPRPRAAPTSRRSSAASDGPARSARCLRVTSARQAGRCPRHNERSFRSALGPARRSAAGATKHRL